jgi:hypothetical protein
MTKDLSSKVNRLAALVATMAAFVLAVKSPELADAAWCVSEAFCQAADEAEL